MPYTRTRDWATVDYYATLGVDTSATGDDIARAFRSLAKQLHPDAGVTVDSAERFHDVTVAYEVLSNERLRRDYDAVRSGLLPSVRTRPEPEAEPAGPPPRFRASQPKPLRWTRRRAWMAFIGGILVLLLGVGASFAVIALQHRDAQRRSGRVAVEATVLHGSNEGTIQFRAKNRQLVRTDEPTRQNPGLADRTMAVLYDPAHPTDVIADESYVARNITLWIVAIKFLIGGPVFAILGWRALRRLREPATNVTRPTGAR